MTARNNLRGERKILRRSALRVFPSGYSVFGFMAFMHRKLFLSEGGYSIKFSGKVKLKLDSVIVGTRTKLKSGMTRRIAKWNPGTSYLHLFVGM